MFVGYVRIELHIPAATSLKDKRSVVRGLKDRIRQRALAAVAEVDHQDLWQRAALGVAVVFGGAHPGDALVQDERRPGESSLRAERGARAGGRALGVLPA